MTLMIDLRLCLPTPLYFIPVPGKVKYHFILLIFFIFSTPFLTFLYFEFIIQNIKKNYILNYIFEIQKKICILNYTIQNTTFIKTF